MPTRYGPMDEKVLADRIAKAHASKNNEDHRGVMVEGLFGEDDISSVADRVSRPILAIDRRKDGSTIIQGKPRTATFHKGRKR